ncbi:hypothetical protein GCM10025865_26530 [Paraoerskovia sediminicola]|uniref:GmrSD restriction endonucleases N-terminal domain-containing protein n=1 Tax=Paraoerskovia sediminicola TaxID=1138587 RepID=A0ABM8G5G5_9CELL|nr:DUF262 domain-containing protein [Paraoerskovia sediminicola]BDZ43354.1 hypothetical protein GCM10025865_26530 [Paraoerskovia sediminicola]
METNVRTPMEIFNLPQHLLVPLFQRPYVWEEDDQWQPLWQDLERLAEVHLADQASGAAHFLGAVVLQAHGGVTGAVPASNVIDGQQRLTTLQLVLDAAAAVFEERGIDNLAAQLDSLTHNSSNFVPDRAEQLKIRHTNKDRSAFDEVMNASQPIEYASLKHTGSKIARAHAFSSPGSRSGSTGSRRARAKPGRRPLGVRRSWRAC